MFLKSKSKLLVFVFASFLVQSACTKDEESMKNPVKTDATHDSAADQAKNNAAMMSETLTPVYFDFDSSVVKDTDHVMKVSEALKSSQASVQVAGHCDPRGTTEYNLALGSRRATEVKNTLVQMGVQEGKITTISYGKEQPAMEGNSEAAWAKDRRAEFHVMN